MDNRAIIAVAAGVIGVGAVIAGVVAYRKNHGYC